MNKENAFIRSYARSRRDVRLANPTEPQLATASPSSAPVKLPSAPVDPRPEPIEPALTTPTAAEPTAAEPAGPQPEVPPSPMKKLAMNSSPENDQAARRLIESSKTLVSDGTEAITDPLVESLLSQAQTVTDTVEGWFEPDPGKWLRVDPPREVNSQGQDPVQTAAESPLPQRVLDSEPAAESIQATLTTPDQEESLAAVAEPEVADAPPDWTPQPTDAPSDKPADENTPSRLIAPDTPPGWKGANWEVDAFSVPNSVAELFFNESFFRSVAHHIGESVKTGLGSLLVSSLASGEGRSTVAIGIAIAAAASGQRVALVDVDLESPSLIDHLGLDTRADWVSAIRNDESLESISIASLEDSFTLIPLTVGTSRTLAITSQELDQLMERTLGRFDLVIFDGPIASSWASDRMASRVDSAVIIRDTRRTESREAVCAANALRRLGVQGVGVIDNFCQG